MCNLLNHRAVCALAACAAMVITGPGVAQNSTNTSDVDSTALNPPSQGPGRAVQRLLSSPRLDATTVDLTHIGVHYRLFDVDANGIDLGNYRESIRLFRNGLGFIEHMEGDTPPDSNGVVTGGAFDGVRVWGGEAYIWERLFILQGYTSNEFDTLGEQNTFGGLTLGGGDSVNPHYAFFAGLISTAQADEMDLNGRDIPPVVDGSFNGPKPVVADGVVRGIWSTFGGFPDLFLRAIEGDLSNRASDDPDPDRGLNGASARPFQRLHYSEYDLSQKIAFEGSWFGEQRFGRIGNLTMNADGALAFRADIGLQLDNPVPGIWADQINTQGVPTPYRVFMRHASNDPQMGGFPGELWLDFLNTGSTDQQTHPDIRYRVLEVGVPALTDGTTPTVFAYAVLNASEDGQESGARIAPGSSDLLEQTAIIARTVGTNGANPNGFREQIIAIEGEPFTVLNSPLTYQFVIAQTRAEGFPGLADMPTSPEKPEYKLRTSSISNLHAFHPRPSINGAGEVAFLGTLGSAVDGEGADMLGVHPLEPVLNPAPGVPHVLLNDEGVYTTRGVLGVDHFERVALEGDPAPVVVNGQAYTDTYFIPSGNEAEMVGDELQTFSQPVINNKGEIVFMGAWVHDPNPGGSTFDDLKFGRSIFISREPGKLECLVSTGDLTFEDFTVPDQDPMQTVKGVHEFLFSSLAVPENAVTGLNAVGRASCSDCGVLTFTSRLAREDNGEVLGWGLFIYNTDEPTGLGFTPRGPQLVLKTSVKGGISEDFFDLGLANPVRVDHQAWYNTGISVGPGDPAGGDAMLHPDGSFMFALNPDGGDSAGVMLVGTPDQATIDFDLDTVLDGCDNCKTTANEGQEDSDVDGADGVGDICDNCPTLFDPYQADFNDNGIGNRCETCPPDFFEDGVVDGADLNELLSRWKEQCAFPCPADLTGDGVVDGADLPVLLAFWGPCPGSAQQAVESSVPPSLCESCFCSTESNCTEFGVKFGAGPDFNQDGVVDNVDMEWMMKALGIVGESRFDMNRDRIVDAADLVLLAGAFTK